MKTIYQPKGKAHEYCHWACNLYNGCSNKCDYCYNRHCQAKALLGKDEPTLKKGLENTDNAFEIFKREFDRCEDKIMADGGELFFNFVSDPFLDDTMILNKLCICYVLNTSDVVVRTLTKCPKNMIHVINNYVPSILLNDKSRWKIGFTLTGRDDLEPGADTNDERVDAIRKLSSKGYHTWASIEPVIDPILSVGMISKAYQAGCRDFKIGLLSGNKNYMPKEIADMKATIDCTFPDCNILWKDSVTSFIQVSPN